MIDLISHYDGIRLEHIVCKIYSCEMGGVGRLVLADGFMKDPFLAAILALSPVYLHKDKVNEIEDFFCYYKIVFEYPEENLTDEVTDEFIDKLEKLVKKYYFK